MDEMICRRGEEDFQLGESAGSERVVLSTAVRLMTMDDLCLCRSFFVTDCVWDIRRIRSVHGVGGVNKASCSRPTILLKVFGLMLNV